MKIFGNLKVDGKLMIIQKRLRKIKIDQIKVKRREKIENTKMAYSEKQSALKSRRQLQEKLELVKQLENKLREMDKKMVQKGYQKINSVMMRNVQVKHTSEFLIKLSDQYFAEVKTHTALQYLARKSKSYEQHLKKVNLKIQVMEQKSQNKNTHCKQQQLIQQTYTKSTVQSIGKNDQGQQIFNIIEVQEQLQTQSQVPVKQLPVKQLPVEQKKENTKTNTNPDKVLSSTIITQNKPQKYTKTDLNTTQKPKQTDPTQGKSSSGQQSQQGGDLLIDRGQYTSGQSSLDQIQQQQENDENLKNLDQQKPDTKNQQNITQKPLTITAQKVLIQQSKIISESKLKTQQLTNNQKAQSQLKAKPQPKPIKQQPPQEPPKPVSRFKLQRMKQKLQSSIQ